MSNNADENQKFGEKVTIFTDSAIAVILKRLFNCLSDKISQLLAMTLYWQRQE